MAKSLEVPRNRIIGFYHLGNIFCAKRWLNRHIYIKTRWPTCMNLSTDYQIVRKFSIRLKRIIGLSLINAIFSEVFFVQNVINSIFKWPTCFFYQISSEFRGNFSDFNIKVEFRETYFFLRRFFRVPWLFLGFFITLNSMASKFWTDFVGIWVISISRLYSEKLHCYVKVSICRISNITLLFRFTSFHILDFIFDLVDPELI